MKKLIATAMLLALPVTGSASWFSDLFGQSTPTVVINQSPAASFMTGLTQKIQNTMSVSTEFYQSRDCADAATRYENSSNVIMPYELMNVAAAKTKNMNCNAAFNTNEVIFRAWGSFSFCHRPDDVTPLNNATSFGMSGMHPYEKWTSEFNNLNNANLKVRVYKGSKGTLKGLLSKDIDWGFIATPVATKAEKQGTIVCDYNTDERTNKFIGNFYKHSYPGVHFEILNLAKGDKDAIMKDMNTIEFNEYLTNFGYSYVDFDFTDDDRKEFDEDFNKLKSYY